MEKVRRSKLDFVARSLGANIIYKFFEGYVLLAPVNGNGEFAKEYKIRRLSDNEDTKNLKKIGSASGLDFAHCFRSGINHSRNFLKRVCAYKMESDGIENTVTVTFYCKK